MIWLISALIAVPALTATAFHMPWLIANPEEAMKITGLSSLILGICAIAAAIVWLIDTEVDRLTQAERARPDRMAKNIYMTGIAAATAGAAALSFTSYW